MRLKRFALRGMIILAVVIALCVLFSGTIRSLTTPKVRFAQVKQGKFENVTELTGQVVFPEEEEIGLTVPGDVSLTVTKVLTAQGKKVKEGDKLLTIAVADQEKTLASLRADYDTAQDTLDAWERKNGNLRLTPNELHWKEAYEASKTAEQQEREARMELLSLLKTEELPEELPKKADKETKKAWEAWQSAADASAKARALLQDLDRFAIQEDIWTLLKAKEEAEQKKAEAESRMMAIMLLNKQVSTITAPHSGYITDVLVEKGSSVSGDTVLLKITAEKKDPVIRMDISGIKQTVKKGTAVTVNSDFWGRVETKVISTGVNASGHPYADAEITDDVIYALGQVEAIMKEEIKLRLTTRAQESTCLVPASAVRGSGDARYVYVGEQRQSAFEGSTIKVQKMTVTVLAESASTVSIAEDLSYMKVLYMEDRAISEGGSVMLYEE